jgi:hypothetical protein
MQMKKRLPYDVKRFLERLRSEGRVGLDHQDLFEGILDLVEHLASHEHLIRARGRELEPDHLAYRLLQDPQLAGMASVNALLGDLSSADLKSIEEILLQLELHHGEARTVPPNHRTIMDAAVLGPVAFVYSRKYAEILATQTIPKKADGKLLLKDLLAAVDDLFPAGPPAYLWRLGPEFGTDRNIAHLLERGDWFIARSLYAARANRLARTVQRWKELPNGEWIGEACTEDRFTEPLRSVLLRWYEGRRCHHALLSTNLFNTPWEEILRFYRNRSCKRLVDFSTPSRTSLQRRVTAAALILAIFTFRNFKSWALAAETQTRFRSSIAVTEDISASQTDRVKAVVSNRKAEVFVRMGEVVSYLESLTSERQMFSTVAGSTAPLSYLIRPADGNAAVPALGTGQVILVGGGRDGGDSKSVMINHGSGFVTAYSNLDSLADGIVMGAHVEEGQEIGRLDSDLSSDVHFEAGIARKYLEKGIEPSVSELLPADAVHFLDPLALMSTYSVALVETGNLDRIEPPEGEIRAPDLAAVELFELLSPTLGGSIIFPSDAVPSQELELDQLAEVNDEVLADVLGGDVS